MLCDEYEDDFEVDDRDLSGSKKSPDAIATTASKPSWLADASDSFDLPTEDDIFGTKSKCLTLTRPTTSRGSRPTTAGANASVHYNGVTFPQLPPIPSHVVDGLNVPVSIPCVRMEDIQCESEPVGGGGFAVVMRGTYRGNIVAVKRIFDPTVTEAIRQEYANEVSVLARLSHPNIITAHAVIPSKLAIVMDLAPACLYNLVLQHTLISSDIGGLALQCAYALQHCHARGVIHCDIKAQNYLLQSQNTHIKLIDFGTAIDTNTHPPTKPRDAHWQRGSPQYVSPDVYEGVGAEPLSYQQMCARDVYALGLVINEMFTGTPAFDGLDNATVRTKVLRGDRPALGRAPAEINRLITMMWSQDWRARPSIDEVTRVLEQVYAMR